MNRLVLARAGPAAEVEPGACAGEQVDPAVVEDHGAGAGRAGAAVDAGRAGGDLAVAAAVLVGDHGQGELLERERGRHGPRLAHGDRAGPGPGAGTGPA